MTKDEFESRYINKILCGDCLDVMKDWPDGCIDSIVTDAPYEISFMSKHWDGTGIAFQVGLWKEVLRVCKPGALMLVFGGTRTYHRLSCAVEDAGWEIRDCLMWLYGSGFPKSRNFGKSMEGWHGWGTALKPAYEPILLAMKPLDGTFAHNAEVHGVAGLWIDGGRIEGNAWKAHTATGLARDKFFTKGPCALIDKQPHPQGRWPANCLLDEEAAAMLGQPSRFFYVAKASRKERNAGLEGMEAHIPTHGKGNEKGGLSISNACKPKQNNHPTVKPLALMEYLCKLTKTPTGGVVLDPFAGSGTTCLAALNVGRKFIGIEKSPEYREIAQRRLEGVKRGQRSLF